MQVSNPDKVIFGALGLTKADLVGHYVSVGERMIEFVADHPLTLERFPDGIEAGGFVQKNASKHFPESIQRFEVPKRDGGSTRYPVVQQPEDVAYLANQGTVTFHMWSSTASQPDRPDWFIVDLDPSDGDLARIRRAVEVVGDILGEFGLSGFPMATGSSGFHIWCRLDGSHSGNDVARSARGLAAVAAHRHPDLLTDEFRKKDRSGRVFVDWLRNNPTATSVAPFSIRPRSRAPVAVPIAWDEIGWAEPDGWTVTSMGDRLEMDLPVSRSTMPVDAIVAEAEAIGVDLDVPFDRFGRD